MRNLLEELLTLRSEEAPFLSVYLDTRTAEARTRDGHRQRNSLVWLNRRLSELDHEIPQRGTARDSFNRDVERIQDWVRDELQPATQGLALFACQALGIFRTLEVQVPFENRAVLDAEPYIYPLARTLDRDRAYLAIMVHATRARLYEIVLGGITASETVDHEIERPPERESGHLTRGSAAGTFGATELSYQRYLEGQVRHHLREVAEKARELVDRDRLRHVVLAGDRQTCSELMRLLPRSVQDRVVDTLAMDPSSPEGVVLRESLQVLERKVAAEATRKVELLVDGHLTGGLATMGLRPTVEALNRGQVDELVMNADFRASGWTCPGCGSLLLAVTTEGTCPACEVAAHRVEDLREAMVRQAERTGARLEVVAPHPELERREGVGALLRYRASLEPYAVP